MATTAMWHSKAALLIENQGLDIETDAAVKLMLCDSVYVSDQDDQFIDDAGSDDAIDGETAVNAISGYTGGFAGSGRKDLASRSIAEDAGNNRVKFDAADVTWSSPGLGSGATIDSGVVVKEITSDTASLVILTLVWTGVATNGGDFTVQFNADGVGYVQQ